MSLHYARFAGNKQLEAASRNNPSLRLGSCGSGVRELQRALAELGYPMPRSTRKKGGMDGIYGSETYRTVGKLQQDLQLVSQLSLGVTLAVDGVAGKNTLATLDEVMCRPRDARPGAATPTHPPKPAKPLPAAKPVAEWELATKLEVAIVYSFDDLPEETAAQLEALLTPEVLGIMAGVVAAWGVSHFFGVGELADIILLVTGGIFMGLAALDAAGELVAFVKGANNAESEEDLREAGKHFAKVVAMLGIEVVLALLTRGAAKSLRRRVPKVPGKSRPMKKPHVFHEPRLSRTKKLPPGQGSTNKYGDMKVSSNGTPREQALVEFHEKFHSALSPKLMLLREFRADLRMHGYNRSALLKYIEEAMAESYAQVRVNGLNRASLEMGFKFPLKGRKPYTTIEAIRAESARLAKGVSIGIITVAGVSYAVYLTATE